MHTTTDGTTARPRKAVLAEKFSHDAAYWRTVYVPPGERAVTFHGHEMRRRKQKVLDLVDAYAAGRRLRILDSGCGAGVTMRDLIDRGHAVVGTDITRAMLVQARGALRGTPARRAAWLAGDVERLPFADASFDAVVCMGVLQYLETDEPALGEIGRVVRTGGLVVLTLPNLLKVGNFLDPFYYLVRWVQFVRWRRCPGNGAAAPLSPDDFETNQTFANRRYYHGQLAGSFTRHHLAVAWTAPVAFGPPTFWRRPLLPPQHSIAVSECMVRMTRARPARCLVPLANRWVIALRKERPPAGGAARRQ